MCFLDYPQAGRVRQILPSPVGRIGPGTPDPEPAMLALLDAGTVMVTGDNPALPRMPERPCLLDFFRHRFGDMTVRHLLASGKHALDDRAGRVGRHGRPAPRQCERLPAGTSPSRRRGWASTVRRRRICGGR